MNHLPSISDALEIIVPKVEAAIIADTTLNWDDLPKKVYFMHGHLKEITAVLQSMATADTKNKKYPLIALLRDFKETISEVKDGYQASARPRLLIATRTLPNRRAEERKEKNFDPVLIPILENLMIQISKSNLFGRPSAADMNVVKWDCYFYGTGNNDKNLFNDYIDAIDVEGISLKAKNIC